MKCAKEGCQCCALRDDECCYFHSTRPEIVEVRRAAQRRGGSKNKLPQDKIQEFITLRAEGYSFRQISEQIGVSKPTLIKWSRKFGKEINAERKRQNEEWRKSYRETLRIKQDERMRAIRDMLYG
jgi:DNA invertase Pin-like site-specific DNA recombinase